MTTTTLDAYHQVARDRQQRALAAAEHHRRRPALDPRRSLIARLPALRKRRYP